MKKAKTGSIEWNEVTPLSRILAAILFVGLPFIAFFWGMKLQQTLDEPVITQLGDDGGYMIQTKTPPHSVTKPVQKPLK